MSEPVVTLNEITPEIVQITMCDKVNKNTYTPELITGLIQAFQTIDLSETWKVVVLTGYGNYFASGGTQDGLMALYEGKGKFTDVNFYSLALDCKIPVISAMQGHGIGGGFVMGLFADFVILSRESVYTTNFMKYGFTPGMGATLVVPKKFGFALGEEMLLNAANYRGADLAKRGCPFPVYPRAEVLDQAHQLARQLAEKPRHSLITLKAHLTRSLHEELEPVIQREVDMHAATFHQPEVRERIHALFGR